MLSPGQFDRSTHRYLIDPVLERDYTREILLHQQRLKKIAGRVAALADAIASGVVTSMRVVFKLVLLGAAVALVACVAPNRPAGREADVRGGPVPIEGARPLVMASRVEPSSITTRVLGQPGVALSIPRGLFNAQIAVIDGQATPRPQLVEALPALYGESWRVFADGRMETSFRLKPNLAWHDGTPLNSEDFVFAWHVYRAPEHGHAAAPPFHAMDEVGAPDPRTVAIRWDRPYPAAGVLSATKLEFVPLPRHILQQPFEQLTADSFAGLPYWTREYVGLGPYRLDRWEPGAFLEASAFEGYVLGRPRIERMKLVFISESNTTLANVLAGEVHFASDDSIGLQQIQVLKREWGDGGTGAGTVHLPPGGSWRTTYFQLRPETASPPTILDARVRKALAHAVDRPTINEAVWGGSHLLADSMISPQSEFGAAADRGAIKYQHDLRRSEQLMNEAGFAKGPEGFYATPSQDRFAAVLASAAGSNFEAEMTVMGSEWRRAGFSLQELVIPAAQAQDAQLAATFPAMATRSTAMGEPALVGLASGGIPRPDNRWRGPNRGGWSNLEYDRLAEAFNMTLDPEERARQVQQMVRIYSEALPAISLFFPTQPAVHVAALRGPQTVPAETNQLWNIHDWVFR